MICLDKLQKVIARELKIPLDTLPNIHDSLRNAGFSEIKKGNEIISLEVKHNEIKEHEKIESKQDLERVKESQKEAIKLQQELKTAEKARKEAFKAVEQTAQKINKMVESEDSALFQELQVGNGHIRSYALAKHINPQQYPNIKEIAELIETLKQQNTHFKETWKAAQDKEIQYEEAYRNFLAQHINTYMNKKIPYDRDFRTENINTIAYKLRILPDHYRKTIIRELIENTLNIKPLKEFGTNYAEYYRDGYHAVNKVLRERSGQVAGAFYKEGLGDIDLVWGDSKFGLAHILERRTEDFMKQGFSKEEAQIKVKELLTLMPDIIENGKIFSQDNNKIEIITDKHTLVLGLRGNRKFVITELIDRRNKKRLEAMQTGVGDSFTDEPLAKMPLSSNQHIDSTTNKAIKQEATQTQSRSWQIQGMPEIISPEEVDSFVKALGKNHIASHITNMDRETATKLAPYIQQFHSINNGARNYLVEHWDTIKQAYKDGKVSKKEFQFLSRYGKKDALINRITNLIQHYIKPIMENYLYEIDERGIKTYKPQNFYNNYIASPTQKNMYGNEIGENIMRLVTNKIAEAKKYLDKHIYYVEKAQKQAEAIVKKQEAMLHDDYDLLPFTHTFTDSKGQTREIPQEVATQWLETFGLKSIDDIFVPNMPKGISEVIGNKEIKLTKGSLYKLIERGREHYIPQIRETLESPNIVIRDKDELIFAKSIKDTLYLTSVGRDFDTHITIISNAPKTKNTLQNKIKDGAEVIYRAENAEALPTSGAFTETNRVPFSSADSTTNKAIKQDEAMLHDDYDLLPVESTFNTPKQKTINAVDKYAQSEEFKALSKDKQEAILSLKNIEPSPMPENINNPHITLEVEKEGIARSKKVSGGFLGDTTNRQADKVQSPKLAENTIPQTTQQIQQAMQKFKFNTQKAKDLLEWHRDSHEITKDTDGLPKVFYHGTGDYFGFEVFRPNEIDGVKAIYFSSSKKVALTYAQMGYTKEGIYEVFLKTKNPLVINAKKKNYGELDYYEILTQAKEQGNDSVVIKNVFDDAGGYYDSKGNFKEVGMADTFIVFDPNQIKSINNKGSYTDSNGNITATKPKDTQAEFTYFNESSPNIMHANPHATSAAIGGAIGGLDQDEDGNIVFNPQGFALGLLGGAGGSKGISLAYKRFLEKNPQRILPMLNKKIKNQNNNKTARFEVTKELEKAYRNAPVTPSENIANVLNLTGKIKGDFIKLAQKHPEYFANPQEVKSLCDYVFAHATVALPAKDKRYSLIIAPLVDSVHNYGAVAFRVQNINGEHRIRSVLLMEQKQVDIKMQKAKELGEPILQFW